MRRYPCPACALELIQSGEACRAAGPGQFQSCTIAKYLFAASILTVTALLLTPATGVHVGLLRLGVLFNEPFTQIGSSVQEMVAWLPTRLIVSIGESTGARLAPSP